MVITNELKAAGLKSTLPRRRILEILENLINLDFMVESLD